MKVDKDTTLKDLKEIQYICMIQHQKSEGVKMHPCSGCMFGYLEKVDDGNIKADDGSEFYLPSYKIRCEGGTIKPCDWVLPRVDYE